MTQGPEEYSTPTDDPREQRVLFAALDSFRQYRQAAHYNITHLRRQSFYSLPYAHVDLLSEPPFSLPQTFRDVDDAIDSNAEIAEAILEVGLQSFGVDPTDLSWQGKATPNDMDKARSTIRQLYRDWSAEGARERDAVFAPIRCALEKYLRPIPVTHRHQHRVLVPGAGLGRLVFDLCAAGYAVEGNEISYHQLLASDYVLNHTERAGKHLLYPWALSFSNHLTRANQLRLVAIPDVHPQFTQEAAQGQTNSKRHYTERMSMSAGDFCILYQEPKREATFDAVTTCFFIDTAPNIISYIETIRYCLKPGGLWVNVGPLLWHFEAAPTPAESERQRSKSHSHEVGKDHDRERETSPPIDRGIGEPGSFELSNDEVTALVQRLGFEILDYQERIDAPAGYITDDMSMSSNVYRPSFWVARKA